MHTLKICRAPLRPLRRAGLPLATALAALLATALPAQAQFLQSNVWANESYYNYNTNQGVAGSGGTSGGSTGTGGAEAAAWASYAGGSGPFYAVTSAAASADYASAGLHASIMTDGTYGDAAAYTRLDDNVTFHVAGGSTSTVTRITVDLKLNGSISSFTNASYLYNFSMSGSGSGGSVGWTTVFYDSPSDPRNYVGWAVAGGAAEPGGFESWELLANTATEKHFRGVIAFTGADKEYALTTNFNLRCSGGTDCDFGNSAHVTFDMPAGVSFTSASGLLLTAVPEPGSWSLMLGGLAAIGAVGRRRRRG